jgi:hypothetical protein
MDFKSMPLTPSGEDTLWVIKDRLTKLVTLIPCKSSHKVEQLVSLFFSKWVQTGKGVPRSIVSDRDPRFTSELWNKTLDSLKISLQLSTSRHQQTDGSTEIAIKAIAQIFTAFVNRTGTDWLNYLPSVEFALNDSISSTTGFTPFYLAYGMNPHTLASLTKPDDTQPDLHNQLCSNILKAKERIAKQQDMMILQSDVYRSNPPDYQVGDLVLLSRNGIQWPQDSTVDVKLLKPFLGPFKVKEIPDLHQVNVTLDLPPTLRIHPTFHVSVLRRYHSPKFYFPNRVDPSSQLESAYLPDALYTIEKILDIRTRYNKKQYLVKWLNYDDDYNTWETIPDFTPTELALLNDYLQTRGSVTRKSPKASLTAQPRVRPLNDKPLSSKPIGFIE